MEGALKIMEKIFGWIAGIAGALVSMFVFYQYTDIQNLKKEVSEKYVLKGDCQGYSGRLHTENREDHQMIFNELKDIRQKMMEMQTMILQEIRK